MKQIRSLALTVFVVLVCLTVLVFGEEFRSPVVFKNDVDFDVGSNLKIQGTKVTATAAQLNAAGGGTTATLTPTTVTASGAVTSGGTLTSSKAVVNTPETVTYSGGGNKTLTVTNSVVFIAGHSAVVTMTLANATAPGQYVEIWNAVGTNIVFNDSELVNIQNGASTSVTNGQWDVIKFRAYTTNWNCLGVWDN